MNNTPWGNEPHRSGTWPDETPRDPGYTTPSTEPGMYPHYSTTAPAQPGPSYTAQPSNGYAANPQGTPAIGDDGYASPQGTPAGRTDYAPPASWSATSPTTPPVETKTKRAGRLPALVAIAVLSAGVGGGAAIGVDRYLGSTTPTATTASSTETTVTKVVQGNSSAPDWTVTAAAASKSAVSISVATARGAASGSGVVLDTAGNIVTNYHVVASAGTQAKIIVQIGDRQYGATIVGTDVTTDLAVIKLTDPPSGLTPITFADSSKVAVGDPVMAIGNPLGLSGTVTTGIVSALNRPVTTSEGGQSVVTNAIQTSAAINPGNSGGALVNANGELIGINSAIASLGSSQSSTQAGNIGIGFAIESNVVKYITEQLISKGSAQHSWLGVSVQDATVQVSDGTLVGAKITQVTAGSSAASAGLQAGDVVTSVAGRPVSSVESLVAIVRAQRIGDQVEVKLVRDGKEQTATVTLAAQTTQR